MAGTREGGLKAAAANKANDPEFYSKIAKKAQEVYLSKPKKERAPRGFAYDPEKARAAGRKGGLKSRRTKKLPN